MLPEPESCQITRPGGCVRPNLGTPHEDVTDKTRFRLDSVSNSGFVIHTDYVEPHQVGLEGFPIALAALLRW